MVGGAQRRCISLPSVLRRRLAERDLRRTRDALLSGLWRQTRQRRLREGVRDNASRARSRLGQPHAARRPEAEERLPDQVILGDRAEEARFAGVGPVVSHDEDVASGNSARAERAGLRPPADADLSLEVGILHQLAVREELAVPELYRLPGTPTTRFIRGSFPPSGLSKSTMSPRRDSSRS